MSRTVWNSHGNSAESLYVGATDPLDLFRTSRSLLILQVTFVANLTWSICQLLCKWWLPSYHVRIQALQVVVIWHQFNHQITRRFSFLPSGIWGMGYFSTDVFCKFIYDLQYFHEAINLKTNMLNDYAGCRGRLLCLWQSSFNELFLRYIATQNRCILKLV